MSIFAKIFGTKNDRVIKDLAPRVAAINALEERMRQMSDTELSTRILDLKSQISQDLTRIESQRKLTKEDSQKLLDQVLHEVFAITREAGRRVLNMRHFDVQLMGGMVLNSGKIAEMGTGEGKTLVATLPSVLNALAGRGVHVVTVNDYLASRDAEWMGRIYRSLGLSVGVVLPNMNERLKKEAYLADITHGQNNEFGFDYLRDNMKFSLSEFVQRGHYFAIVDEVDSILIDEARTPLIISGPAEESTEKYQIANSVVPKLRKDADYTIDEKSRVVILTEAGIEKCEKLLNIANLYDPANIEILHHVNQALRAHSLYKRDVDYVIEQGEVVIVDEHTGRLMHGRRWSDGLHQAVEAKENVKVQAENQTLATVTFQNYFRMYQKLSGMTGTADTEAEEFAKIYDLDVVVMPPNRPRVRQDEQDQVYRTEHEKLDAIVKDIEKNHTRGQPLLVGTVSVEKSEVLSKRLKRLNLPHTVLNAKRHRDEAAIVAQAGRLGAITIATNMAGRGTDIVLGGNPEFMARIEVAKHFGQSEEQIAEFEFLTGSPDLVNIDKLAEKDVIEPKYIMELENQIAQGKVDVPKTVEEARNRIFNLRKAFYEEAFERYAAALKKVEDVCKDEKEKVRSVGGLRIIGTERHESRRIDNQLRGRAGRQGDPGSSCFYLSLEDDLIRVFASERMIGLMQRLSMEEGVVIEHPWVSKSIANAQKRIEGFHFDSRKQVIEYDDVMNQQRNAIYGLRKRVLGEQDTKTLVFDLVEEAIVNMVAVAAPEKTSPHDWKLHELEEEIFALFGLRVSFANFSGNRDDLMDYVYRAIEQVYLAKEKQVGADLLRQVERFVFLQTIDRRWKEHLQAMDHLREGIHFQGYAQKDPKQEYKKEGYNLFTSMMANVRDETLEKVFKVEIAQGTRERVTQDISRLEAEQRREAEKLKQKQVLTHGQEAPAKQTQQTAPSPMPMRQQPAAAPVNRHQRRLMQAHEKKSK